MKSPRLTQTCVAVRHEETTYAEPRSPLTVFRVAAGLKQIDLARSAGVCRQTVSRLERGHHRPEGSTAAALAAVLGVEVEELFPVSGAAPSSPEQGRRDAE